MNENKYELIIFKDVNIAYKHPDYTSFVLGEFQNNGKKLLEIIYMKDLYERINKHCAAVTRPSGIDIFVSESFLDKYINKPDIFKSLMFHELGHFVNGDLNEENLKNINNRNNYIETGIVCEMEVKADAFACKHVGKDAYIFALQNLIIDRINRNDEIAVFAVKELLDRIEIIKNSN